MRIVQTKAALERAIASRHLLLNLVQRDLRTRYRRSVLGWGWSMVNPAITTLIYVFVFSQFFHVHPGPGVPSGQSNFGFFLLAGLLPWNLLTGGVNGGMGALLGGAGLMSKVSFSREHLVAGTVIAMAVSFCIELGVLTVLELTTGYIAIQMLPVAFVIVVLLTIFVLGIALWFAALNIRYRDIQHLVGVFFLVWFYLTPIVYPPETIPKHSMILGHSVPMRDLLMLNPMSRFVQAIRNCFYDITLPGLNTMLALTVLSVVSFTLGYSFFISRSARFIEEL